MGEEHSQLLSLVFAAATIIKAMQEPWYVHECHHPNRRCDQCVRADVTPVCPGIGAKAWLQIAGQLADQQLRREADGDA